MVWSLERGWPLTNSFFSRSLSSTKVTCPPVSFIAPKTVTDPGTTPQIFNHFFRPTEGNPACRTNDLVNAFEIDDGRIFLHGQHEILILFVFYEEVLRVAAGNEIAQRLGFRDSKHRLMLPGDGEMPSPSRNSNSSFAVF